ncbi:hypothetical protein BDZ91DRAFT_728463 [Kalaharituber pfeilii]|nr:hypothetical protein BDZ91DRAFT_728463 [Kalaharituber pfeilii]
MHTIVRRFFYLSLRCSTSPMLYLCNVTTTQLSIRGVETPELESQVSEAVVRPTAAAGRNFRFRIVNDSSSSGRFIYFGAREEGASAHSSSLRFQVAWESQIIPNQRYQSCSLSKEIYAVCGLLDNLSADHPRILFQPGSHNVVKVMLGTARRPATTLKLEFDRSTGRPTLRHASEYELKHGQAVGAFHICVRNEAAYTRPYFVGYGREIRKGFTSVDPTERIHAVYPLVIEQVGCDWTGLNSLIRIDSCGSRFITFRPPAAIGIATGRYRKGDLISEEALCSPFRQELSEEGQEEAILRDTGWLLPEPWQSE